VTNATLGVVPSTVEIQRRPGLRFYATFSADAAKPSC
jgi:hypothetical protein